MKTSQNTLALALRRALLGIGACTSSITGAATLQVDNITDDPDAIQCTPAPIDCSLRGAVLFAEANPGPDTLLLPSDTITLTIGGAGGTEVGDLNITSDITIRGVGQGTSVIRGANLFNRRGFGVSEEGTLTLEDLTLTELGRGQESGGAILASSDTSLRLLRVDVTGNRALTGGAIAAAGSVELINSNITGNRSQGHNMYSGYCQGGGLSLSGETALILNSTISGNSASDGGGGGVYARGGIALDIRNSTISNNALTASESYSYESRGAGICAQGATLTIDNTTVHGNRVTNVGDVDEDSLGGGLWLRDVTLFANGLRAYDNTASQGGGLRAVDSQLRMSGCTFSGNQAPETNMGVYFSMGGGMHLTDSVLEMSGCTFTDNAAFTGGGALLEGVALSSITNSTFSDNAAMQGEALHVDGSTAVELEHLTMVQTNGYDIVNFQLSTASISNTIMEGSCGLYNAGSEPTSGGGNVTTDISCIVTGSADELADKLLLGPLKNNGGPALTHLPVEGSPVLSVVAACSGTDQRGIPRGDPCDAGAVERPAVLDVIFANRFEVAP